PTQKVFANMRRVGKGFSGVETPLFKGMLVVGVIVEEGDAGQEQSILSPTLPTSPLQQPQDLPSTSQVQEALAACAAFTKRVEHLQTKKVTQALEITKLKRKVKKLEKGNRVKVLKLRRLKKVGTSQRINTSDDTVIEDASNQERMIDALDMDEGVALIDDKEAEKKQKRLRLLEDEPEVLEVVDVVTTTKLITEVVTAASESVTDASITISAAEPQVPTTTPTAVPKKQQVELNEEFAKKLHEELNKHIDWDMAIEHVKQKAKEDLAVQRYQVMKKRPQTEAQARKNMITYLKNVAGFRLDYFKGMSYDDIQKIGIAMEHSQGKISTSKPDNFFDDFLLTTLGAMYEKPDGQAQVWKSQRTVHGTKACDNVGKARVETIPDKDYILVPLWTQDLLFSSSSKDSPGAGSKPSREEENKDAKDLGNKDNEVPSTKKPRVNQEKYANVNSTNNINTVSPTDNAAGIEDNAMDENIVYGCVDDPNMPDLEEIGRFSYAKNYDSGADMNNLDTYFQDERDIVIKNKARLVTQGYTQEERINYDEVFAHVARIKEIRLFLAYASFKDFVVYQMNVKSAFLYGKIKEEMSSIEELTFFLGLQVKQKEDGIFICQDKYASEILNKTGFSDVKTVSTPIETQKPLFKDEDGVEVDVHMYRSMIGSLVYLISLRPDIMFAVCACARFQVNPKISHLHFVKRIFRYLKGQPKLGLWYPKDSPFDLVAIY
nr:uncharacterized mitochondrial protein AtMg00810-like [Tanacetum cinerariifolium]